MRLFLVLASGMALLSCGVPPGGRQSATSPVAEPLARPAVAAVIEPIAAAARSAPTATVAALPSTALQDLSLDDCLQLAWRHNRSLLSDQLTVAERRWSQRSARRSVFDPQLSASYTLQEGDDPGQARVAADLAWGGFAVEPFVETDVLRGGDTDWTSTVGLRLSRALRPAEALRQRLPLQRATRDLHVAILRQMQALRELELRVTRAFFQVQRLQHRLVIRRRRVADAERFLADIEARVPRTAAPIEATNARIDLKQAQSDLLSEETALLEAKEALLDLLGADLDAPVSIVETDLSAWQRPDIDLTVDRTVVLSRHERLLIHDLDEEIATAERRLLAAERWPDLRATLTVEDERQGSGPFDDGTEQDSRALLGFSLNMPLDGWLVERSAYQRAVLAEHRRALQRQDIVNDLIRSLQDRWRRLERLDRTVRLQEELLQAERDKLKATLQRYRAGSLDNLEVTRAKVAAEQAELNVLSSRIERLLAVAEYRSLLPPVILAPAPANEEPATPPVDEASDAP